jgi:DNA helicase HerA-like ATPase
VSEHGIEDSLERFRAVRRDLEVSVLPLASSVDGRRFTFQASLHDLQLRHGGYVALGDDGLGQVLSLEMGQRGGADLDLPGVHTEVTIRHAHGEGVVVEGDGAPFHDALIRPAVPEEVGAWLDRTRPARAQLHVGELALAPGVPCALDAGGFDRHTFLCGQSGSGKTYSLGVMLERLLMETGLRVVILDPNSDFVRLDQVHESSDGPMLARYREVVAGVRVPEPRLRLAQLDPVAQAALLRLDPVADRDEYAELAAALVANEFALDSDRPLATRARNLGVDKLGVWARDAPTTVLDDVLDAGARCVVVDLGSLATREEQSVVAGAVLGALWERRERREPVLIVIDEAHNVCPAEPDDQLTALAAAHVVRIAAEGRKFGLYLLVSTQRPQKVQENVISQCDNLVLMRLNSAADTAFAQAVFSFVPASLVDRATTFRLGEALVAGKISPQPALIRFGARIAQEGGADVPATWATPRAATASAPAPPYGAAGTAGR